MTCNTTVHSDMEAWTRHAHQTLLRCSPVPQELALIVDGAQRADESIRALYPQEKAVLWTLDGLRLWQTVWHTIATEQGQAQTVFILQKIVESLRTDSSGPVVQGSTACLHGRNVSNTGWARLLAAVTSSGVTSIDIQDCALPLDSLNSLLNVTSSLEHISLRGCLLSLPDPVLVSSLATCVSLCLSQTWITSQAGTMASLLDKAAALQHLSMRDCRLTNDDLACIVKFMSNGTLSRVYDVDIAENRITDWSPLIVYLSEDTCSVTRLSIAGNRITVSQIRTLCVSIGKSPIYDLDVSGMMLKATTASLAFHDLHTDRYALSLMHDSPSRAGTALAIGLGAALQAQLQEQRELLLNRISLLNSEISFLGIQNLLLPLNSFGAQLRSLDLSWNPIELRSMGLICRSIRASQDGKMEQMSLRGCALTTTHVSMLIDAIAASTLMIDTLDLSHNQFDAGALTPLFHPTSLSSCPVSRLCVAHSLQPDAKSLGEWIAALETPTARGLTSLDLSGIPLSLETCTALTLAVSRHGTLSSLVLRQCGLDDSCTVPLVGLFAVTREFITTLTRASRLELDVSHNALSDTFGRALAAVLVSTAVEASVDVRHNHLTESSVWDLVRLQTDNKSTAKVSVSHNRLFPLLNEYLVQIHS